MLFNLFKEAFRNLDDRSFDNIYEMVKSKDFIREGAFIAEFGGNIIGFIRVKCLRNNKRYELWDLLSG